MKGKTIMTIQTTEFDNGMKALAQGVYKGNKEIGQIAPLFLL